MLNILRNNSTKLQYLALASVAIAIIFFVVNLRKHSQNVQEGLTDRQLEAKQKSLDDETMLNHIVSQIEKQKDALLFDDYSDYYKSVLESAHESISLKMLAGIMSGKDKDTSKDTQLLKTIETLLDGPLFGSDN
jgi:hypothetical protein